MGLFAVPDNDSKEELVKTAIANLQLYLDEGCKKENDYMLTFAKNFIEGVEISD